MENQGGENKIRNNTFYFHYFIHFFADLIGPLYICVCVCVYIYIYLHYTYIYIRNTFLKIWEK